MDHDSALQAANQALSGNSRSTRIAAVELNGVDASKRGTHALPSLGEARPQLTNEAWQIAATIGVAVATLALVITLWLL